MIRFQNSFFCSNQTQRFTMDSIFNSGVPHIGEKILKCMDIKSIVMCRSVNQGLRSYMESYIMDNLQRKDFFKRIKSFLLKKVSTNKIICSWISNNIEQLWLPLIEIIDEKKLWNHEVKQQFYLCLFRILHRQEFQKFRNWDIGEHKMMILNSAIGKKISQKRYCFFGLVK